MLELDKIFEKKEYLKTFVSTKQKGLDLFFRVKYQTTLFRNKDINNFSIVLEINYLNHKKIGAKDNNKWMLVSIPPYNQACSFDDSIMIEPDFTSFGIGSFLLNEMLTEAIKHIPNYSLRATLSINDERNGNKERRDSLYRNIGFNISEDEINIDKISNLNLDRKLDYIKEIDISLRAFRKLFQKKMQYM